MAPTLPFGPVGPGTEETTSTHLALVRSGGQVDAETVDFAPPRSSALTAPWVTLLVLAALILASCTSGSPGPSGASPAASNPAPSGETSPSPTTEPTPGPLFVAGQIVQVNADELEMRAAAGSTAAVVRILDRGEWVRIASGPTLLEGQAWYEVTDIASGQAWVPAGEPGEPMLVDAVVPEPDRLLSVSLGCPIPPPHVRPVITITGTGRVIAPQAPGAPGQWSVRQLSARGLARIRQEVLEAPLLQASAHYPLELLPDAGVNAGSCDAYSFVVGDGADVVVVTSTPWQGDAYEASSAVPSPGRRELDRLAHLLASIGEWLDADGWIDPAWRPYAANSYLLRTVANSEFPAPDGTPSSVGMTWPFAGPIEAFGDSVDQTNRCGYLDLPQAFETVRLLRGLGVDARLDTVTSNIELSTDAGWITALLSPSAPDGIPNCADEAPTAGVNAWIGRARHGSGPTA